MSNTDERIVQMEFDNAQFERGVKTSINSIEKLKQALNFSDVGDSFDKISKSANRVDLSGIQNSLDSITKMFSPMGLTFVKVWTDAIGAVEQKISAFNKAVFKDPFEDGFKEYELKMDSVQTIMNSSNESLETVNKALAELNTYADKTIYSFSDMTTNIGKFTNAGVSLKDAVAAIQGVSNVAALSGANANEASRAMYNFAQALSSGAVKLIDWKSIENANMATQEFKQELIDTAVALGTLVKVGDKYVSTTGDANGKVSDAFNSTMGFNDSLSHLWMTTDVLTTTLAKFADESTDVGKRAFAAAQDVKTWSQLLDTLKEALGSGWATSFEIIIGNFEEAKTLFTTINNSLSRIIDRTSDIRNGFLLMWRDNGGREKFMDTINKVTKGLDKLFDTVENSVFGTKVENIINRANQGLSETKEVVDALTQAELDAAWAIWRKGAYGNGEERKRLLEAEGLEYERVQGIVDKIAAGTWEQEEALEVINAQAVETGDSLVYATGTTQWFFRSLVGTGETFLNGLKSIGSAISNIVSDIGSGFGSMLDLVELAWAIKKPFSIFTEMAEDIESASEQTDIFVEIGEKLGVAVNTVSNGLQSLFSYVEEIYFCVRDIFELQGADVMHNLSLAFVNLALSIKNVALTIGYFVKEFVKAFFTNINFSRISNDIVKISNSFYTFSKSLYNNTTKSSALSKILNTVFKIADKCLEILGKLLVFAAEKIYDILVTVKELKDSFIEWASNLDEHSRLYRAWSALKTIAEKVWTAVKNIGTSIANSLNSKTAETIDKNRGVFSKLYDVCKNIVNTVLDKLVNGLEAVASLDFNNLSLPAIGDIFGNASEKASEFFGIFKSETDELNEAGFFSSMFTNLQNNLSGMFETDGAKSALDSAFAWASGIIDSIIQGLCSNSLRKALVTVGIAAFVWDLIRLSSVLTAATNTLGAVKTTLTTFQTQITKIGTTFINSLKAMYLDRITFFILALAGSLIALTFVDTDKLTIVGVVMWLILRTIQGMVTALADSKLAENEGGGKMLRNFSSLFTGFALLVAGLSFAIAQFKKHDISVDDMFPLLLLVLFVSAIAGAIIMLVNHSQWMDAKIFKSIGIMMAGIAAAAWILMKTVMPLRNIKVGELFKMFIPLIGVILMLSALLHTVTRVSQNVKGSAFIGLGIAVAMIIGSMNALIPLIITFSKLKSEVWEFTISAIFVTLLSVAVMVLALTRLVRGANARAFLSFTFMLIASLGALGAAFYLLDKYDIPSKISAFITEFSNAFKEIRSNLGEEDFITFLGLIAASFLAIIAVLGLVISGISRMGNGATRISRIILRFSLAFAAGAAGVFLIVNAIEHLPGAANGIVEFSKALEENGPVLKKALLAIGLGILGVIGVILGWCKYKLILGIILAVVSIAKVIYDYGDEIYKVLEDVIWEIVIYVGKLLSLITSALVTILAIFINEVALALAKDDMVATAIESLIIALGAIVNKILVDVIKKPIEWITEGIGNMFKKMGESIGNATKGTPFQKQGYMLSEFLKTMGSSIIVNAAHFEEANKLGRDAIADQIRKNGNTINSGLKDVKTNTLGKIGSLYGDLSTKLHDTASGMFGLDSGNALDNLFSGMTNVTDITSYIDTEKISNAYENLGSNTMQSIVTGATGEQPDVEAFYNEYGEDISKYTGEGIENGSYMAVDAYSGLLDDVDAEYNGVDWGAYGYDADTEMADGFDFGEYQVEQSASNLTDAIKYVFKENLVDDGWDVGHDFAAEVDRGLRDGMKEYGLDDGTNESVGAMLDWLTAEDDTTDAAKATAESVQNIEKAVTKLGDAAKKTSGIMGPTSKMLYTKDSLLKTIERINANERSMSSDVSTVRLSESLSDVYSARMKYLKEQEYLDSMTPVQRERYLIDNKPEEYAKSWEDLGKALNEEKAQREAERASENFSYAFSSGLLSFYSGLKQDIDNLDKKMDNIQVVMDTGAVVGAVAPAMNSALGEMNNYDNYTSRSTITTRRF